MLNNLVFLSPANTFMYLNCKTYFSYRYGTLGTEELMKLAAENGANALAITNINNTSDVWDFVECYPRLAFPGVFSTFSK